MTILITGSTGSLGSTLIDLLRSPSHPFFAATRRPPPPRPSPLTRPSTSTSTTKPPGLPFSPLFTIHRIHVPPRRPSTTPQVRKFATLCAFKGVKRMVFMAGASAVKRQGIWAQLD
ncbi:hypothetical protein BDZ85DRAFT_297575 [Elsinoe ampelina]|uniref:Uncharacterized protein n=1 Tax=Elsinoe ampelina TaxID=302913 RepID=A0A6A6G4Z8_9PEZI|nr:hypothetical protein BDZ85DRAFT_297575 [Elsinoe ampelina]